MFRRLFEQFVREHSPWGPAEGSLAQLSQRESFSRYFNWKAYDPETQVYVGYDDSIGFLWESVPLCFADPSVLFRLESLLQTALPQDTIIQLHFHADDYIRPFTQAVRKNTILDDPLVQESTEELIKTFESGTRGVANLSGTPLRNFRLLVACKIPQAALGENPDSWSNYQQTVAEILTGAYLHPRHMPPERLLAWARWLLNGGEMADEALYNYDPDQPINRQVLCAQNQIQDHGEYLKIGKNYFRATSPKNYPQKVNLLQTHELFGGIWGMMSDSMQIPTPFLFTLTIIYQRDAIKNHLHTKCNLMLQQRAAGSFAPSLMRKQEELVKTVDQIERGMSFVRVIPTMWVWSENKKRAYESIIRIRSLWEPVGYLMQEERAILQVLFLLSMPFGLILDKKILESLDRDFILQASAAARIMPVQADFRGTGSPVLPFIGRKGQVVGIDLFTKEGGTNMNALCVAASGTGKSFLSNFISFRYRCAGAKLRIIDIGGSYRKLVRLLNARYIEFTVNSDARLNPFTSIRNDDTTNDDSAQFLEPVIAVVTQMCFSKSDNPQVTDLQSTLIRYAVKHAWRQKGNKADIDDVYRFLAEFPDHIPEDQGRLLKKPDLIDQAHYLAIYMEDFITGGAYGRYFNGPSNFDISTDDVVVLELEHLMPIPPLFRVVTLQVINNVTADLYLAEDRSIKRLILLDEAHMFLKSGGSASQLASVIDTGYRRARKYGGSFTVISQSLMDLLQFGDVGPVILSNSAYKFLLQSRDFHDAKKAGLLEYDEFAMKLLTSTASNKPKYSEIYIETPHGRGHVRFMADDYNYYVYTSDPEEVQEIEEMVAGGLTYDEAIWAMVKKYRRPDLPTGTDG